MAAALEIRYLGIRINYIRIWEPGGRIWRPEDIPLILALLMLYAIALSVITKTQTVLDGLL